MAGTLRFHTLDVFTDTPYAGNPLAVVLDADGLDNAQMQIIAREFNLSETIFVMAPRDARNIARVRIFFPTAEIPFAGHPTIGCALLLAQMGRGAEDFETELVLEEEAGPVPVRISRIAGRPRAEFTAPVLPHLHHGPAPADLVAAAIGLPAEAVGFAAHRPGSYRGGPAFLFVPLRDRGALAAARPAEPHWSDLMRQAGVDAAYLYTPGEDCDYRARMFSPTAGIPEDPATGSASAILAAQLLDSGALANGETRLLLHQGLEMGRPSRIDARITVQNGALTGVHIAGSAVAISAGELAPPPPAA
ncbi:PhzF family phenazine biosynthesis protein [Tropicimonas sp.]|uniref:PhzF family phenazine biosynthesis protein n=1 Tax=Tropicimonas sp. TaxID=2067044 RepID=UPI003A841D66